MQKAKALSLAPKRERVRQASRLRRNPGGLERRTLPLYLPPQLFLFPE
jgi:hypothetical protein